MYQVRFALNEIEKIQAYALRHQGLAIELGDKEWILHPHHLFVDELDNEHAHIVTVWDGRDLIGTVRILFRCNAPFLEDDFYQWQWLSRISGRPLVEMEQRTFLLDRSVVKPAYRRMGIYTAMLQYACRYAATHNMQYMLTSFAAQNSNAHDWARKNEFNFYPELLETHTGKWYLAYKQLAVISSPEIATALVQ